MAQYELERELRDAIGSRIYSGTSEVQRRAHTMNTTDKLRHFIIDQLRWDGASSELTDDYPLLESGVIDSLAIFEIVGFIEDECGVEVADDELVPENFATLAAIANLVKSKA
jgi:acyl carrier protein